MRGITKIVKSLEDSSLLIKDITLTTENETKVQRDGFLSMLLGTLGTSLLGNMLAAKGVITADDGLIRAGSGVIRGRILMPSKSLTHFKILKY